MSIQMARRAVRNTYGIETVGAGIEIRRRVMAGQEVPGSIVVDSKDLEEYDASKEVPGYNPEQVRSSKEGTARQEDIEDQQQAEAQAAAAASSKPARGSGSRKK